MRSIWTGSITFGLISIPVKLYTAVSDHRIEFSLLHEGDGAHIKYKRVSEKTGREVAWDQIVKGYEVSDGKFVTFTHEELDALDVESLRVIDIDTFCNLEDIDPIYYDKTYYIAPREGGLKAYRLLARALGEQGRVGIAKFAMREKEHLCALRVADGERLVLETMHWPAEIRDSGDLEGFDERVQVREREVEMAMGLVDQLTGPFEPGRYRNTFEQHVKAAAKRKLKGEKITVPPDEDTAADEPVSDLLEQLEASLKAAKGRRSGGSKSASASSSAKARTTSKLTSDLAERSKEELYELAQERDIEGRSGMTKDELVAALER